MQDGRAEPGRRGALHVRDRERPDLIFVCMEDKPRSELIVVTLWEEGEDAEVPKRFTDALRTVDRRRAAAPRTPR
jgi:hypothetical protein